MRMPPPNGCTHCGLPERAHLRVWTDGTGWHTWVEPSDEQREARTIARQEEDKRVADRAARAEREPAREPAPTMTEAELEAYLDAVDLVRESGWYERAVVSEIRQRDQACGKDRSGLDAAVQDRRTLLGLYDHASSELRFALEDVESADEHLGDVQAACDRLIEHARVLERADPAAAAGVHRAVNVIARALYAPFESGED